MTAPRGAGEYQIDDWPPEAHIAHMHRLNRELVERGQLIAVEALAAPGQARLVRAGEQGDAVVTDGPFAEAKEYLAGYWIVEAEDVEAHRRVIYRAVAADVLLAPDRVEQVGATEGPTGAAQQQMQQRELGGAQVEGAPARVAWCAPESRRRGSRESSSPAV